MASFRPKRALGAHQGSVKSHLTHGHNCHTGSVTLTKLPIRGRNKLGVEHKTEDSGVAPVLSFQATIFANDLMPSHPLELPDVQEDRIERTVPQRSSIPPALVEPQIKGTSGSSSNRNAGQNFEEVSQVDVTGMACFLALMVLIHIRQRENEGMGVSKSKILLLSAQAEKAQSKFERLGIVSDIEEEIKCRSEILALTPEGHAMKPSRLGELGVALCRRFLRIGGRTDLDKAIDHMTQAVQFTPHWHSSKPNLLGNLGVSYESRYEYLGRLEDLNKAIQYQTQAVLLTPDGDADKPSGLNNLGNAYLSRFDRLGELADVNKAIEVQTEAVLLTPDGHAYKPGRLSNLGNSYQARFERLGELADVNKAIRFKTEAVQLTPDGHADKPKFLNGLGNAYRSRFQRLSELADLDNAIDYLSQAVLLTPDGHSGKPRMLSNLGISHRSRFGQLGELADVNRAIEYLTQALQLTPDDHAFKLVLLNNLGGPYFSRFERLGELADLNTAIDYFTQVVRLSPDGHADKSNWLNNLGGSYRSRFERLGKLADLDKAIEYLTQAVLLSPDGHASKPIFLNNLGGSYASRCKRLGLLADFNQAIEYFTQAVLLIPDGHPYKSGLLNNLGHSYVSRFKRLGELADLNKSIEYIVQAVLLTPDGHPEKPFWLINLGSSYESRFRRLGVLADLNQAIEYLTQAVLITPDGHAEKPNRLDTLGISYHSRFRRLGELADLNKAIQYQTQAVLLTHDGDADKPILLTNLGCCYQSRFERLGEVVDVNNAIENQTEAVLLTPDGHADKPGRLINLGSSYQSRFERLGEVADVNKAIEYKTEAVQLTPDGHADKPKWLYNLGNAYWCRFKHLGHLSDLELAQSSFQTGAQFILTHPQAQFMCARKWARCSISLGSSPQSAFERCMELIPHYIWHGVTIDQRYTLLSEIGDLATEAAAWAISAQSFELALEWLEEGRSIVWNQILQLRIPFDDLAVVDPALAQDLRDTASKLEAAGSRQSASLSINESSDFEQEAQQHYHLASKWERLLGQVRAIPGFQSYLQPRKANELMRAATDGPIVVLNAHPMRCDALIVFPGCKDIEHLPLSNSLLKNLNETCLQLSSLTGQRGYVNRGFKRLTLEPKPENIFKVILATLWSDIVQPVWKNLAQKHEVPSDRLPHITWCTTGAMSFLPLHAAGLYNDLQPNAPDLFVSSYTPTLSALLAPTASAASPDCGVLAVGQEHTRGFCSLPSTVHELAAIEEQTKVTRFQQLDGEKATIAAVIRAMDNHSWIHLACHATQNPDNPAQSAFHLSDGSLTLEAITQRSFKNKGLAFLSACQTATGDRKLADEAIHLAAGMLMAGYPSVIATMWSIQDEDGPEIARAVYAELLKDGRMEHRQAARALHQAVAGLRANVGPNEFMRWVPFIHIGV